MNDRRQTSRSPAQPMSQARRLRWSWVAVGVLVCAFAGVMHQRDRIRAHWWASQLIKATSPEAQAYYLASLSAVGEAATGAVKRVARHERPEVRALAVVALSHMPNNGGPDELRRLLEDVDRDVAESAALSLAFMGGDRPLHMLIQAAASDLPGSAGAAAAALSRVDTVDALNALCTAAARHPHAVVRAQAVESLAARMMTGQDPPLVPSEPATDDAAAIRATGDGDPIRVLVAALSDRAMFRARLSLERQIAAAAAAAAGADARAKTADPTAGSATLQERTVAQIAANALALLTGRRLDPRAARTAAQQAELAAQCRRWLADRRAAQSDE